MEESTKFLGQWCDSRLSFKKHISVLQTQCREALNLIRVVAHLKWGGDRDTLLMLYRAIVRSKLDYGCIVYGTASNTNLRQLDSIHNSRLRLPLGAFCTSPISSLYTEANETPLEERGLKLSLHYYLKPRVPALTTQHIMPCMIQTKWDVAVHGRDLYLMKPTLGPPKKFQHLTRAEEGVTTRLRIGHTKAAKSHILSRGPPTACHHCGQTLTIEHMLLECAMLQECRDEYCTVDSLNDNS